MFINGVIVNGAFYLFKLSFISYVTMEMSLSGAIFIGREALQNGGVFVCDSCDDQLHGYFNFN